MTLSLCLILPLPVPVLELYPVGQGLNHIESSTQTQSLSPKGTPIGDNNIWEKYCCIITIPKSIRHIVQSSFLGMLTDLISYLFLREIKD